MGLFSKLAYSFSFFGATLGNGLEQCANGECVAVQHDAIAATGSALLQTMRSREVPKMISTLTMTRDQEILLAQAGYSDEGYQGSPSCVPDQAEAKHRRAALLNFNAKGVGGEVPLDASGFKKTTSLCCPSEMETFFNRLLDQKGLDVCSKDHVQGLMHWFACVPEMDFQYVLDVIDNGNPCKYWAPKGQSCPELSTLCMGQKQCGAAQESVNEPTTSAAELTASPTTKKPKNMTTTANASTLPPTTQLTTTKKMTTATTTKTTTTVTTTSTTTTTTTTTTTNVCQGDIELKFWNATVGHSNLGGRGPDAGPEHFVIGNLGYDHIKKKSFDMIITSTSDRYVTPFIKQPCTYCGDYNRYNGVYGFFGTLYMNTNAGMDLKFQIVETGTTTPMKLHKWYFSFLDLDTADKENDRYSAAENLTVSGFQSYLVGENTELEIKNLSKGRAFFQSTKYGNGGDNPKDPFSMTDQQKNRAVVLEFIDTSEFEATYEVAPQIGGGFGREMFFGGKSQNALDACANGAAFRQTSARLSASKPGKNATTSSPSEEGIVVTTPVPPEEEPEQNHVHPPKNPDESSEEREEEEETLKEKARKNPPPHFFD